MDLAGPAPELISDGSNTNSNRSDDDELRLSPLENFNKLGQQIFYFEPSKRPDATSDPDLVILCSWLYARVKHIAKYTAAYQEIYPSSPIILLKQDGPDMIWRPNSWQMDDLQPAVSLIQKLNVQKDGSPRILMHVFSNGGAFTACQLADAYHLQSHDQGSGHLPISALVIDSAPSFPSLSTGFAAMSQGLPPSLPRPVRAVAGLAVYTSLVVLSAVSKMLGSEGVVTGMRRRLNDPSGPFMQGRLKRIYIYSQSDEMVPYQHVEMHAHEAETVFNSMNDHLGNELVQMEKFEGSKHVAHVVVDAERYWNIIQALWSPLK